MATFLSFWLFVCLFVCLSICVYLCPLFVCLPFLLNHWFICLSWILSIGCRGYILFNDIQWECAVNSFLYLSISFYRRFSYMYIMVFQNSQLLYNLTTQVGIHMTSKDKSLDCFYNRINYWLSQDNNTSGTWVSVNSIQLHQSNYH